MHNIIVKFIRNAGIVILCCSLPIVWIMLTMMLFYIMESTNNSIITIAALVMWTAFVVWVTIMIIALLEWWEDLDLNKALFSKDRQFAINNSY